MVSAVRRRLRARLSATPSGCVEVIQEGNVSDTSLLCLPPSCGRIHLVITTSRCRTMDKCGRVCMTRSRRKRTSELAMDMM